MTHNPHDKRIHFSIEERAPDLYRCRVFDRSRPAGKTMLFAVFGETATEAEEKARRELCQKELRFSVMLDGEEQYRGGTYNDCLMWLQQHSPHSWHYSMTYGGWDIVDRGER